MSYVCNVCSKKDNLNICTGCRGVYYCGTDCQKEDWPKHKELCKLAKKAAQSGYVKEIIKEGEGECPPHRSQVEVHYTGTLLNGEKFDSSRDRNETFKFKLGVGQVIKGWDEGVKTMKVGERARFVLSPEYGYGKYGSPPVIPGNAVLVFDVELIGFK